VNKRQIVVGTRGSALALRQTDLIVEALRQHFPEREFVARTVQTEGDRRQDRAVSDIGDKGIFTRALERSLLDGAIDLAVHSLKDVPSDVEVSGLILAAFSPRADPRDCLISRRQLTLERLPKDSKVGTGSLRRKVQLNEVRPDLIVSPIRGNVDTRLKKLQGGQFDAIVLAVAGLERLGLQDQISEYLSVDEFVPDCGQGIIVVQSRREDETCDLLRAIDDFSSRTAATAERATVRALEADCRSPVGVHAVIQADTMVVRGVAATEDGSHLARSEERGRADRAQELGHTLGSRLLKELQRFSKREEIDAKSQPSV
jgi:hydroxymethylbilane synthase